MKIGTQLGYLSPLGPFAGHVFHLQSRSQTFRSHLQVDLTDGKYVSARKHRKGHPESGEKARSIKGVWPKAEIRPNSATETSETVRTHPQREYPAKNHLILISRETVPVRAF